MNEAFLNGLLDDHSFYVGMLEFTFCMEDDGYSLGEMYMHGNSWREYNVYAVDEGKRILHVAHTTQTGVYSYLCGEASEGPWEGYLEAALTVVEGKNKAVKADRDKAAAMRNLGTSVDPDSARATELNALAEKFKKAHFAYFKLK